MSWTADDISFVGKLANMATISTRGSAPLVVVVGQVKTEAPPRYSGKRQPGICV